MERIDITELRKNSPATAEIVQKLLLLSAHLDAETKLYQELGATLRQKKGAR